jgi:hypothetical protein
MYIERTNLDQRPQRIMREYLFDSCLVIAANVLVGHAMSGFGISNIRNSAINGPVLVPGRDGLELSYSRYTTEADVASESLIERLASLGLWNNPEDARVGGKNSRFDIALN